MHLRPSPATSQSLGGAPGSRIRAWLNGIVEVLGYAGRTLRLVADSSRTLLSLQVAFTTSAALLPLVVAYVGKRIIDAVVAADSERTLKWVLLELAAVLALTGTQRALGLIRQLLSARMGADLNAAILEKALGLDLTFFENAEFYDKLTRARREASSRPLALVSDCFQLVQNVVTLLGYSVFLTAFGAWVLPVLFVATIPATFAEMHYSKLVFRVRNWRSPDTRRLLYLEHVLANDEHAKEVKLFGIGPLLLRRYKDLAQGFYLEDKRLALRRAGLTHVLSVLGVGAFYATYASMAFAAARGNISVGALTLYVVSLRQGQQAFQSVLSGIGNIYEHNLYMSNLFSYLSLPSSAQQSEAATPRTALARAGASNGDLGPIAKLGAIRFEDVGFRYPNAEGWALRHVDLEIAPGESVALVGENGAGKTTFVKLLTGLYKPTEGRVSIDGRDVASYPEEELRQRFAVVFQDFNQYQFRVRENVGLGSVQHLEDVARIARAVERGGASELVQSLPGGLEQPLGHWFEKGSELSGGQWQKLALARAFMREEASILILDEPTAALDAKAEHAVFQHFRELSRGRTSIIIS
ncbi:MAG TPA: ABC transporter ATP-binding protein, partial [Polyangiaceae bacterium]|nr:ABC transporter ATP-binding protein [Polyangiaceae bacterium]